MMICLCPDTIPGGRHSFFRVCVIVLDGTKGGSGGGDVGGGGRRGTPIGPAAMPRTPPASVGVCCWRFAVRSYNIGLCEANMSPRGGHQNFERSAELFRETQAILERGSNQQQSIMSKAVGKELAMAALDSLRMAE